MAQYVLISGQYKRLLNRINEIKNDLQIENIYMISPYIFFEIDTNLSLVDVIRQIKIKIYEVKSTWELFFQIYPILNGKIDYYPYMSTDRKKSYTYYKE